MSFSRFIELLQQLITMTDPEDEDQVRYAVGILQNLHELARRSDKIDRRTLGIIYIAIVEFSDLLRIKEQFAGSPGDVAGNLAKRKRLAMALGPRC